MTELRSSKVVDIKNKKGEELTPGPCLHGEKLDAADLAPDGGWGWIVAAGYIVANLMTVAQTSAFGLVYGDFLEASGNGGSALTTLNLAVMLSFSLSGLICNELLKRYSIKAVGVFGATVFASANTAVCLAPNVATMAVLSSIQGMGLGLTMTICTISFNAYFVKHRTKVLSAAQVVIGLGTIAYPIICEHLLATYGFRGCLALLGIVSFHAPISMFAMDPVERHYKMPKPITIKNSVKTDGEVGSENIYSDPVVGEKINDQFRRHSLDATKGWEKNRSIQSLGENAEHKKPLLINDSEQRGGPGPDAEAGCRSRLGKGSSLDFLANRLSMTGATSMSSINGLSGFPPIPEIKKKKEITGAKSSILSRVAEFFEISLLRDAAFVNICVGAGVVFMTDMLFTSFVPMIMASEGYAKPEIAVTLTVGAIAELVGRILFMVFAMFAKTKARYIFLGSVCCLVCCRMALMYCDTLMQTMIVIGLSGVTRSWNNVVQTLVIAEHVKIEKFAAAWGLFIVINGVGAMIFNPLIGIVKDLTQSYVITQYALIGSLLTCVIPWTIEILIFDVFGWKKRTVIGN